MYDYDLICIGSGPAGEKAATQSAYYQKRVAIIEKERVPGGAMINTGTIASKVLRETALQCSSFRRRPLPGVSGTIDLADVSVARFMARTHLIQMEEHDRIEQSMDRHAIDVHQGMGRLVDPHTVEVTADDGTTKRLSAEFILIAVGSTPFRPGTLDFSHPGIVDADGVLALDRMPRSMVVVGGGVIGSEYASIFAEIGVAVTLVEPRDAILPFLDDDINATLVHSMLDNNITFRFGAGVDGAEAHGEGVRVQLGDGSTLDTDCLLWAAGRSGNTASLGLDAVGLEANKRGQLVVDDNYRTTVPSIYAAGDVIGFPALASTSMEQGRVAACHMFGKGFKDKLAQTVPMGIYTIPAISMVGLGEKAAIEGNHDVVIGRACYRQNPRARMLGDDKGMLKLLFDRRSRVLVGAGMVGALSTELIHLAQAAIVNELGMSYFIDGCFNYPALTEIFKYATYDALQQIAAAEQRTGELGDRARVA